MKIYYLSSKKMSLGLFFPTMMFTRSSFSASISYSPIRYLSSQKSESDLPKSKIIPFPPPTRVKGVGKKLILRSINRTIVSRITRRAMIGIPIAGVYFASRLIVKDTRNVFEQIKKGNHICASAFSTSLGLTAIDLFAQVTIISALAVNTCLIDPMQFKEFYGFAALPALLNSTDILSIADKVSLTSAGASCITGIVAEYLRK
jgi:hypothetical protein